MDEQERVPRALVHVVHARGGEVDEAAAKGIDGVVDEGAPAHSRSGARRTVMTIDFDAGVLLVSATLPCGTRTFASGKYATAEPRGVASMSTSHGLSLK